MMVLRFSPVSSGLFSFNMSNTRSAKAAGSLSAHVLDLEKSNDNTEQNEAKGPKAQQHFCNVPRSSSYM